MLGVGLATNILPALLAPADRLFAVGLDGARKEDEVGGPSWKRPILECFHSYYVLVLYVTSNNALAFHLLLLPATSVSIIYG